MEPVEEATRVQILDAARQLIIRQGYDATGVSEICKAAGVSKGAFYYHFESKHQLFLTLLSEWLSSLDTSFASIHDSTNTVMEQFEKMAGASDMIFHTLENPIPTFLAFWSKAYQDPNTWQETIQPFRHYQHGFEALLDQGKQSGSLNTDISSIDGSRILVGMAIGIILQGLIFPEDADWQQVLTRAVKVFNTGLERSQV